MKLNPTWRRRLRRVRWGSLRRTDPVSHRWGYDRGNPVDRHYIEAFLAEHTADVRGDVLEVKDSTYTNRYGAGVTTAHVVDIDPSNQDATIVADLSVVGSLPSAAFDCAVVTQTLMVVPDARAALENLWQSLRPGGTLLVTAAFICRVDPDEPQIDRWRFSPAGLRTLLDHACPDADVAIRPFGNVTASIAFLHGLASEELRPADLDHVDPRFPVVTAAVVRRP